MKRTIIFVAIVLAVAAVGSLPFWHHQSKKPDPGSNAVKGSSTMNTPSGQDQLAKLADKPVIHVETGQGNFTIRLYSKDAPELTKNFIELAKSGYYNGLTFHRVIPGFVVQGGDPQGDGTGGHSYLGAGKGLADEAGALALKHLRGSVAWAKSSLPNSIGSQFYIALDSLPQLDGGYSVFGQVVDGLDTVDRIASVKTDQNDRPLTPVTMTKVTVEE